MLSFVRYSSIAAALLAGSALADATSYSPYATGFTLPNAQEAVSALSAQTSSYATTAGSTGYAANAGSANTANYATSAGSATTATNATTAATANYASTSNTANSASYAANAGVASQAAELTAGNNCGAGTALTVTSGILGCVSSVTSITGQLNGAQIVGDITNVGSIYANGYVAARQSLYSDGAVYSNGYAARDGSGTAAFYGNSSTANAASTVTGQVNGAQIVGNLNVGSINATGNIVSNGYTYGIGGLFTDNAVFSNTYVDRNGGGSANFYGNASTANYAASSVVGILYQGQLGNALSYYCDAGYHVVFYDTNVDSTNNAFFYGCVANGH
jgi:hypothetical protein